MRLIGLDVARCLALLGMMATHVLPGTGSDGSITVSHWLASGRASALFAVLAGVSLSLVTGRTVPVTGADRRARTMALALRAVLIALLGLALGALDTGIAIILAYYGVLFLLGLPFLGLRARWLALLAAVWVVVGPVLDRLLVPHVPRRQWESPRLDHLEHPGRLLGELLVTGYYPALPWLAYLLAGMAVGRLALGRLRTAAWLTLGGAALAVGAGLVSRLLLDRGDVREGLLTGTTGLPWIDQQTDPDALVRALRPGLYGTTPADGSWSWLLVDFPHSATPLDLAGTIGSALLVTGLCLLATRALPAVAARAVAIFFGAGTMTLSLYTLHVLLRTEPPWSGDDQATYARHVLLVLAIGAAFVALRRRGPLEAMVGLPMRVARRSVGTARG